MSPHSMERVASVSREELEKYVRYQHDCRRAITENQPPPQPPGIDSSTRELFANISTGMRSFWGSNEERSAARSDLFSMQLQFGQPTIFFTISPDNGSTYEVANMAGNISSNVLAGMENELAECLAYTRARLGQIATSNPHVCARYFDYLMKVFIDVVLNWSVEEGCSREEPGLFGCTTAFYAATEAQSSTGSLHAHMLIWVKGMPSTVKQYYEMCASKKFRDTLVKYVDAIATSSVPLDLSLCPSCGSQSIEALELERCAFRKPRSGALRPSTSECKQCGEKIGGSELITQRTQLVSRNLDDTRGDVPVHHQIALCRPLPWSRNLTPAEAVIVFRSLVFYQHHHWFHSKSCFKVTRRTPKGDVRRMFIPKESCVETIWTPENRIEMKREVGNEYINTYVPIINAIFKCNHDIKFLSAGEGPEKAYYTIKYSTKDQHDIENPWALHLHAFDKANRTTPEDMNDQAAVGRRLIQSMCCTLSNPHEISAPMASLYLIKGSVFYTSHQFVKLTIAHVLRMLFEHNALVNVMLESDNSGQNFRPSSVWLDYISRPETLENLNLMTFVAKWERKKRKGGLKFQPSHALFASHSRTACKEKIVTVCHKRLPDMRRTDLPDEELLRYQRTMVALFRPFRSRDDFVAQDNSFNEFFQHWWENEAPPAARIFARNNSDYYSSRDLLRTPEDPEVARYGRCKASPSEDDDLDAELDDDSFESDGDDTIGDDFDVSYSNGEDTLPIQMTKNIDVLDNENASAKLAATSTVLSESLYHSFVPSMSIKDVEQCMEEHSSSNVYSDVPISTASVLTSFPDLLTRVQLLERALKQTIHPKSNPPPDLLQQSAQVIPTMPSLEPISLAFSLNQKQQKMLVRIGKKLLTSILVPEEPDRQEIAFLGGLPGAGKSRVINALQTLALRWDSPESVATGAYQGVAAQAANGQTIHKLFGWSIRNRKKWVPTSEQKDRFAKLKLLILDEISTCDVTILGRVDSSLRTLLDQPNIVFGGIHVLLVGDWLQQLPVAGQPAFMADRELLASRSQSGTRTADYLDRVRGITAYRSLTSVVILTENMRHQGDPLWRSILEKWRVGIYDQEDIDFVNKLAHRENWTSDRTTLKGFCPIIVTSNALRVEFNASALRKFCDESQVPLHRFPAKVRRPRHPFSRSQRSSLECVRDDKTKGMPLCLEIAIGSSVQCTKNVSRKFKLANGSIGTVVAITPAKDDTVQVRVANGIEEHSHTLPPDIIYVKLKDYGSHSFDASLPLGVVPICRRLETGVSIKMSHRSFSVSISQVPLVLAYSLTTEKCQGLTVDKMILAPLRHPTRHIPQRSSFYVAVTRVKTLSQLYLMAPLTKQFLEYFKPSQEALEENRRLQAIEDEQVY